MKSNSLSPRSGLPLAKPAWELTFWYWHMQHEALHHPVRFRSVSQGAPIVTGMKTYLINTDTVPPAEPAAGAARPSVSGSTHAEELSGGQLRRWIHGALAQAKDAKTARRKSGARGSALPELQPFLALPPGHHGKRSSGSHRGPTMHGSGQRLSESQSVSHLRRRTPPEFLECQRFLGKIDWQHHRKLSFSGKPTAAPTPSTPPGGEAGSIRLEQTTSSAPLAEETRRTSSTPALPQAEEASARRFSRVSVGTEESAGSSSSDGRRSSDGSFQIGRSPNRFSTRPGSAANRKYLNERRDTFDRRANHAFAQLSSGDEITTDELQTALEQMGNPRINTEWIDEICQSYCRDRYCLSCAEFSQVAKMYEEKHWEYLQVMFMEVDAIGTGMLSYVELKQLLQRTRATPMPGAVKEQIRELFNFSISKCAVTMDQFMKLHDVLASRYGFTTKDWNRLTHIFTQHDADENGILDVTELRVAFSKCFVGPESVSSLCAEVIAGGKHEVDLPYFLLVMRRHFEDEILRVQRAFHSVADPDGPETQELPAHKLADVFHLLGEEDATTEKILVAAKLHKLHKKVDFDVEETCLIHQSWIETIALPTGEIAELEAAFQRADADKSGGIDRAELGGIIRWLGYPSTYELEIELLEEFRQESASELNFSEVLTIMKKYQAMEARQVRKSFERQAKADATARLPVAELRNMLLRMGHVPSHDHVSKLEKQAGGRDALASLWDFVRLVVAYRQEARKKLQRNQGFSDRQLHQFRTHFQGYDTEHSGYISKECLQDLLKELFSGFEENENTQRRATLMLKQVDENNDGKLDFKEYLQMMRLYQDQADSERYIQETAVAEKCGYSRSELKDYRQLFQMFDSDASGELSHEECMSMFAPLLPEGQSATEDLARVLNKVDEDGNRELNFAEFLRMMYTLKEATVSQNIFSSSASSLVQAAKQPEQPSSVVG